MRKDLQFYTYQETNGDSYQLTPTIGMYANNGNLSVRFHHFDKESGLAEPFLSATINIIPLAYLEGAIDVNDNEFKLIEFLEANGFGERTPFVVASGFCTYPVFKFSEEKIKEINPKVFAEYQKSYGIDKAALDAQIREAASQTKHGAPVPSGKVPDR